MSVKHTIASGTMMIALFVGVLPVNALAQPVADPAAGASTVVGVDDWPWDQPRINGDGDGSGDWPWD